jgi:hypothetical protein
MTDNIIKFPKENTRMIPQSKAELAESIDDNKRGYVNGIIDHYAEQLINKWGMLGFNIDSEEFMKDYAFSVESLRSGLYRTLGLHHPFQEMIDDAVDADEIVQEQLEMFEEILEEQDPEVDL